MKKTIRFTITAVFMVALTCLCMAGCGHVGTITDYQCDGITYTLNDQWVCEENDGCMCFSSREEPDVWYTPDTDSGMHDQYHSAEELEASFEPGCGIDRYPVTVNGEPGLLTAEPVNEIMYYQIFFYVDGQEHAVTFETDFGAGLPSHYLDFVESISY